ncbi:MAG: NgoFVII family restriction endonuclease [Alphaproteobacteria bacterium]|nr:NgoFVII family restriction endonuclease [Alphaproteobacteria bacterium]
MFFANQPIEEKQRYETLLKITGALSRLSSDSDIPYLYYRMAENIFCEAFGATNLGRSDISLDAKKDTVGLGLKTFICNNGHSIEKIAEFNRNKHLIDAEASELDKIKLIAKMRNERLETTGGITDLLVENMLYHCVIRRKGKLLLCETPMHLINLDGIRIARANGNSVFFSDGINDYSFNFSKSTLFKSFNADVIHEFDINIFDNPYQMLDELFENNIGEEATTNPIIATVYLPLYSVKGGIKYVPERSGLNQWNASGRPRNYDEVYIKIPLWIHREFPNFFPPKDSSFTLRLPNGSSIMAKVCQQGGKALMSNPNSALGDWILRSVLRLRPGAAPVSYNQLEQIGIDSVEINKFADGTFEINFKNLGTFERFEESLSYVETDADTD